MKTEVGSTITREGFAQIFYDAKEDVSTKFINDCYHYANSVVSKLNQEISDWKQDNINLAKQISDLSISISKKDAEIAQLKKQILELQDKLIGSEHPF